MTTAMCEPLYECISLSLFKSAGCVVDGMEVYSVYGEFYPSEPSKNKYIVIVEISDCELKTLEIPTEAEWMKFRDAALLARDKAFAPVVINGQ